MKLTLALLVLLFNTATVFSQIRPQPRLEQKEAPPQGEMDTQESFANTNVEFTGEKPSITEYKIISFTRDITYIDTTLTIQKEYKFNYLRRDIFELLPFSNVGHTYNSLAYDFSQVRLKPLFAARAQHFNYMELHDINYYHVPTPLTEIYYKTAFEQGQQLEAFFTINTSEQFNFSVAYKGLRSLGNYQNFLSSTGNFRFTSNYHTKNRRYQVRAHFVAQDLLNEQNGGVKDNFLPFFINDDEDFDDRGRLEVKFEDAENSLEGKRFYLEHQYTITETKDTTNYTSLKIGNSVVFEDKFYKYSQDSPFEEFGPAYIPSGLRDKVTLEDFYTEVYADFSNSTIGRLKAFAGYTDFNYGYDRVLILEGQRIPNRLKGNISHAGAEYTKEYRGFQLFGAAALNISGEFEGNYLMGSASFRLNENNMAKASFYTNSVAPNYNFLLYQSDYINYNWQNFFRNVKTQHLQFDLQSKQLIDAKVSYTGIDDYTFFSRNTEDGTTSPMQFNGRVNYLKVEANREITFGKFALDNTVLYQQVLNGEQVFKVPQLLARSSFYFSDHFFKRALFLQTGITGKYFSSYEMNAYDPVIAEFYVQDTQKIGDFPIVDFFINAKIRQTRVYFKLEHFNAGFGNTNDYFSAPNYPYRDFKIRFGLVWNFFM